ncbi:MAG: DUF1311 domain-containing protein [Burkholderiales bacterium]|nr:DUF1311 domain-containing protein [Burkholderiales bacterium]
MSRFVLFVFAMLWMMSAAYPDEPVWPEGSAMAVGRHMQQSRDYFLKKLESRQAQLMKAVEAASMQKFGDKEAPDRRLLNAVADLHTAWLAYYPKECELIGSLSGTGGNWPSTHALRCEANLVYRRYLRLGHVLHCIDRIPAKDSAWEMNRCLYQLSPMTYGKGL